MQLHNVRVIQNFHIPTHVLSYMQQNNVSIHKKILS